MAIENFDLTQDQTNNLAAGARKFLDSTPASTPPVNTQDPNTGVFTPTTTIPTTNVSYPTTPTVGSGVGTTSTPFSSALGVQPQINHTGSDPNMMYASGATPQYQPAGTVPFIKPDGSIGYQSDPSAAPTLGTQSDGTLHMNVNGQAKSDEKVFQGTAFSSARDLASQLGLDYKADPKTGEITIGGTKVSPIKYDQNGDAVVGVRSVADALGYKIGYDDKTKTITITGKAPTPTPTPAVTPVSATQTAQPMQAQGYNSPIQSIANGIPQMQQMTPWTPPDVSGFQKNMLPYQQFNPDYNQYYQQAHNQLDPQFNAGNQKLMDKQNMDIQKTDESMNRRGIFSSGVAQAAENDLRAKTTNALAQGFTAQMGHIEKVAETLFNNAYKQYQQGNQFALKNNQDQVTNMLNVEKQSFSVWAQTQKLDQSQYGYALKAWDQMAGMIMKDAQNQMSDNHFNQTMDWNQYKFEHPSAAQELPYQQQTVNNAASNATSAANNAATNQTNYMKIMGFDQNGHPTLETFKALGYIQMPDGSMQPTEQANNNSRTYAMNLAKEMGYVVTPDGKMIPTEQSRHNMATEGLTASGQTITKNHNAATETETAKHDRATETNAIQVTKQNALKETNTNLFNIWKDTGKAPAGIDGVEAGTPFVHPTSNTTADKNQLQSTYIGNISAMTPANRDKFFKEQQAAIVKDLGMNGYNTLHDMYYDFNGKIKP